MLVHRVRPVVSESHPVAISRSKRVQLAVDAYASVKNWALWLEPSTGQRANQIGQRFLTFSLPANTVGSLHSGWSWPRASGRATIGQN
jgi:hypothetical protein